MKRLSAIILAIALAVSVMAEPLSAVWMLTGNLRSGIAPIAFTDSADTMTVVVTHWHASEPKGRPVSESDSSREEAAETLVAQFKHNNVNDTYTLEGADGGDPDSCMKYDGKDTANISSFFVSPKAYHDEVDEAEVYEKFAGFSVTTGNDATSSDGDQLKVTYDENIRLVKIDVLYEYAEPIVAGTPDSTVFADSGESEKNAEKDTSFVYGYPDNYTTKALQNTPIAKSSSASNNEYFLYGVAGNEEAARAAAEAAGNSIDANSELSKVKVYSVEEGLHTDKTATITENPKFNDGRTFDLQLEAWYSGDNKAKVGLVLDSSGSMAFTSAEPNSKEFNKIKVDEGEISRLSIKTVPAPTSKGQTSFNDDDLFVKDTALDEILDTRKTDNSPNGYNGYSYYIYNPRDTTKEFAPIGYWDGKNKEEHTFDASLAIKFIDPDFYTKFDPAVNLIGYYEFNKDYELVNTITGDKAYAIEKSDASAINFERPKEDTGTDGILVDDALGMKMKSSTKALLLDAVPTSQSYTISFKTTLNATNKTETGKDPEEKTDVNVEKELLLVGNNEKYFRLYRRSAGSKNRIRANLLGVSDRILEVNSVYNSSTMSYVTMVFDGNTIDIYLNSTQPSGSGEICKYTIENADLIPKDINIIFNAIKESESYTGHEIYIDDIFVFDCALTSEQVKTFYEKYQSTGSIFDKTKTDPVQKFSSTKGGDNVATLAQDNDEAGWFYVSSTSNYYTNLQDLGSAKTYQGLYTKLDYHYSSPINGYGASSKETEEAKVENYYTYESTSDGPMKFFLDKDGYLCCFYNVGGSKDTQKERYGWSYVYEKVDTSQTKAEVLQRALGLFATGLQETSSTSSIAATKFSTDRISEEDYNQLVLLDWTKSPDEAADVLSQSRGKDAVLYQMTGSTCTYTGLQSFIDNLAKKDDDDVNKKYLIIFTDGKDTELSDIVTSWKYSHPDKNVTDDVLEELIKKTRAYKLAKEIRDTYKYDIYAIMLSGGSISSELSHDDYRQAVNFLAMLTGEETIDDEKDPVTVGAENPTKTDYYLNVYEGSDAGSLITIFSKNIVDIISDDLSEYSVKDYLDPRFDLVDADNNVWKLNDEGKVSVNGAEKKLPADITLSKDRESDGQDAVLNYDAEKHLYYLTWEDVTVPGCNSETVSLPVWNATVTVHAKEDFIGGNYVLTNGNMQLENYVLKQGSEGVSSSGTDMAKRDETTNPDPSKGFPRTTVNVQIPDITIEGGAQVIYMGEELTPYGVAEKLGETIYDNWEVSKDRSQWYWEYLKRYPKLAETMKNNADFKDVVYNSFDDIVDEIVGHESTSFNYYYLPPSSEATNVDGETGVKHETDKLGVLKFDWTKVKTGYNSYPDDNITKDTLDRASALTVTYTPSTTIDRQNSNDDGQLQSENNGSPVYQWDDDFKPAQGSVKESVSATGTYVTKIVSGQTAFDLKIPADVAEYLSKHYSGYTLTYTATLKREYQARSESDGTYETKTDSVGTYTATYSIPDSVTKSSVDPIVCEGIINYLGEYGAPDYVSAYGLPLGVYSFINPTLTVTKGAQTVENIGVKCGDITVEQVTNSIQSKFSRYTEGEKTADELLTEAKSGIAKTAATGIEKFAAEIDTTEKKIYIGKNVEPERDYRDNRYGYGYGTLALDTGSLSITKTVVGLATGEANPDTYTITLSGDGLSGNYKFTSTKTDNTKDSITFTNGTSEEFEITADETVTIAELPLGAEIKIDEDVDGKVYTYTKDISPDSVVISTGESTSTVTNTVKAGSLTISKTVEGPVSTGHENDTFEFTVEAKVGETKLNGTYTTSSGTVTTVKFTDGKSDEITLEDGESITIQGLPVGTEFTVVETKDDNYTTTISDDSGDDNDGEGTIAENSDVTVAFTNTFITGQLSITKTVENGFSTDEKKEFSFRVEFDYTGDVNYSIEGGTSTLLDDNGIKLKHGETAIFDGLPVGTEFTVEEIGTLDDYTVSATVGGTKVEADTTSGEIIAKGNIETTTDNIAVAFMNTRKTGSVTIEKKLTAAEGTTLNDNDNKTPFTFTVNLYESDGKTALTGEYSYSGSANGKIKSGETVELAKDQSITISGLPVDAKVTVSETAKDGFEKDEDKGTVVTEGTTAEDTAKLIFNNVKKAPEKTEPVTISAIKNLDDKPSDVQFSFNVAKPNGTTEVTNDAKGNIEILKGVTFDKVGSYVYAVSENDITGDNAKKYIKDNSVYQITVNVAEEYVNDVYTGKLVATTEIKQTADSEGKTLDTPVTEIIFNNKAKTYSLTVNKEVVLNGRTDIHAETLYGFEVVFEDIDVSKLSLTIDGAPQTPQSGSSITFSLKKDGKAVISNIPYGAEYEIIEDKSDDYVSSGDNLSGNVDGDKTVTVKNTYGLKVAAISATKTLDGGMLTAGQFEFEVTENGVTKTVFNDGDGKIELIPEKTYTEEESHVYTVREVVDTTDTKIKYDKSVYEITVNVTTNDDGELEATTEIKRTADSEGKKLDEPEVVTEITFNNSVIKPATVTAINATKKLDGEKPEAGLFKFEIADENGAKITVTNKADGSIELIPEKTYTEEESHVYTVREVVDENNPKIKYDKSEYEITVNVTKIGDELEATTNIEQTADSEGNKLDTPVTVTDITFENTSIKEEEQPPEPEIELGSITIRKIVGGSQGDKTLPFEFTLSFENLPIGFDTSTLDISGGRDVKQSGAVITFKLADSEELTVKDIPLGTTYLVVETPVDGYGTTAGGVTGNSSRGPISEQKKNVVVEFKNTNPIQEAPLLGGFTVKKTVISDDPDDLETPFEFSIQLDPMPAEPDVSTAYTVSGNVITVHLADGEIAKISSLPYGTSFIVNEAQTGGFESRLSETSVASGRISAEQNDFEIEYVNTRTAPPIVEKEEFGNLTIVKFVSGNGFAEGQQFNFTVQLGSDKLYAYTGTGIGPADGYIRNGDTITLTKNTYIKIHNIPYGTAYSVMEAEADANTVITDGYGIITDGSGIISETNRDAVAQFSNSRFIAPTVPSDPTNPDEPTKLMLTKYVRHTDGTDPDPLAAFTFTVAFASPDPLVPFDFSLNCTVEGQLTSWIDPNTLSVTLHHNESVMVSGMPVGTTYVITEAPTEGYSSKFITGNETGIISAAGQSVSVVAENTKSTPVFPAPDSSPTGSLTITKEVKSGDKSKPFTFIAEFTPMTPVDLSTVCTLGGNYTSAEWNGNILMVQLTDGQAILIDVIPYGTSYNVYESGSEGYRVTPSEEVGTVSSETPNNVASFSNSRLVGSLSVSKTVSLGSKSKPFTFSVVFTPTEQISLRGICRISGSYTSAVWNENVLTLKLTDGQNAIINGIPSNTAYSIVESDNEGYEVSSVNSEGTIIADTQIKASFTNTLECGSLTVKKIVGLGNKQQPFTFTVSFTPNSSGVVLSSFTVISGNYTSAVWNGDILTLMLADGQSATISNIPYGTAYSVVEAPVPLYTSTPDEYASGVISAETPEISTVVVNVQNYNPPSGPIPDNRPVQLPVVDDGPDTDDIVVIPATESGEGEGDEVAEDNEASEESNPKTGLTLGLGAISAALTALVISKRR